MWVVGSALPQAFAAVLGVRYASYNTVQTAHIGNTGLIGIFFFFPPPSKNKYKVEINYTLLAVWGSELLFNNRISVTTYS